MGHQEVQSLLVALLDIFTTWCGHFVEYVKNFERHYAHTMNVEIIEKAKIISYFTCVCHHTTVSYRVHVSPENVVVLKKWRHG
jgi:hypothetical protein